MFPPRQYRGNREGTPVSYQSFESLVTHVSPQPVLW